VSRRVDIRLKGISGSSSMFCVIFYGLRRGILRLVVHLSRRAIIETCNYRNRNLLWLRMQLRARSRSHSHSGIYPDDGGNRRQSGLNQTGQLSIVEGVAKPSSASIPQIYQ
jgi:hypothetical protein